MSPPDGFTLSPDTRALAAVRPKPRYRVGRDAAMLNIVRRYMPQFVFQTGLKRQF